MNDSICIGAALTIFMWYAVLYSVAVIRAEKAEQAVKYKVNLRLP